MNLGELRKAAETIARFAIEAVDPHALVCESLMRKGTRLAIGKDNLKLSDFHEIVVVGAGKAAAVMASAVEDILGDRICDGIVVVKDGHLRPLRRIRALEAAHPVPDHRSIEGANSIVSLLKSHARPDTLVLCLISGGGSALIALPRDPVTLEDKQKTTSLLLGCGASIEEINAIRKHISKIKGGRLAEAASPARMYCLLLSDVVGDPLDTIASGPAVGDPSTFADCLAILENYNIWSKAPQSVREIIERGIRGEIDETPKPADPIFSNVTNIVIGNNYRALKAASDKAASLGFGPLILSGRVTGEAREVGTVLASIAIEARRSGDPLPAPACILAGGETTVTIRGDGKGGRNQELSLAAALKLAPEKDIVIASVGTDGSDGPTDAAGAIIDTTTIERARELGLDPLEHLNNNDSYNLLQPIGDLLMTGPTGTNVMDLMIALVG